MSLGDPACALASGARSVPTAERTVVAVFASPVALHLLHVAGDCGFRTALLEPEPARVDDTLAGHADLVALTAAALGDLAGADVVGTDHDRPDLGTVLRDVLALAPRWVGVLGSPRHAPPHVPALAALGVGAEAIASVHRPIGLDIGSRTPPEIAVSTVAGLIADRNGRPGGFAG